jgi:hypothetical protein
MVVQFGEREMDNKQRAKSKEPENKCKEVALGRGIQNT